jgi:hypothetical protein
MVEDMAAVCSALGSLPLDDLPEVACLDIRRGGEVSLQLAAGGDKAAAFWAWARALPGEVSATGVDHPEYVRIEVRAALGETRLVIWGHFTDDLMAVSSFFSIPPDGRRHPLPLVALRALAEHRKARHGLRRPSLPVLSARLRAGPDDRRRVRGPRPGRLP